MKKTNTISRLLFATALSVGLFVGATAQRERGTRGSGSSAGGGREVRTNPSSNANNGTRIRENNRDNSINRPAIVQPTRPSVQPTRPAVQPTRPANIERNPATDVRSQRTDINDISNRNNPTQITRPQTNRPTGVTQPNSGVAERNIRNNQYQQRTGRDNNVNRDSRTSYNNRGGYNNNGYRYYRPYEPRRYVYVGAPRYSVLPRTSIHIQFGGYPYYYDNGLFFNYYGGYYQPVFAPRGIRVSVLPFGYMPLFLGTNQYYYYNGTYYRPQDNNEYEVVDAPMGAQVSAMPKGTKAVVVNGEKFYEFNGTYYKEDRNAKGEVVYTVVGKNGEIENTDAPDVAAAGPVIYKAGDVLYQLPEGSRTVTINNQQLFVSPDDIYFKLQANGTAISYLVVGAPTE